jgi:hypothetical protein
MDIQYWKDERNQVLQSQMIIATEEPSTRSRPTNDSPTQDLFKDDLTTKTTTRATTTTNAVKNNLVKCDVLIQSYVSFLIDDSKRMNQELDNEHNQCNEKESGGEREGEGEKKQHQKKLLILSTRHALRYMLTLFQYCCSLNSNSNSNSTSSGSRGTNSRSSSTSILSRFQEMAVRQCQLHISLSSLLCQLDGDSKCQSIAAKLLCNLGTFNVETSKCILNDIPLSSSSSLSFLSWGDMIHTIASRSQRETLSAIIATMYNCIIAIQSHYQQQQRQQRQCDDYDTIEKEQSFFTILEQIASNSIFMCNVIRYILPKDVIQLSNSNNDNDYNDGHQPKSNDQNENDKSDDATLWISLLLELLFHNGVFPFMYKTLGFHSENDDENEDSNKVSGSIISSSVTPEQIVLLNCLANSIESYFEDIAGVSKSNKNPLKDEESIYFLAQEYMNLRLRQQRQRKQIQRTMDNEQDKNDSKQNTSSSCEKYPGEASCIMHGAKTILDILGTVTCFHGDDSNDHTKHASIQKHLGQSISFLSHSLIELGFIIDELESKNRGVKARELVVSQDDQYFTIGLVRIIGNLSYDCKSNQDIVRETNVPQRGENRMTSDPPTKNRNGLHVVLSCTSFSYGCFTLREWGIIAIRNILEKNDLNQEAVAKLEAQKVVNTPELEKLGVKLDLDEKGKINVINHPDKV